MICYPVLTENEVHLPRQKTSTKTPRTPLADLGFLAIAAAAMPATGSLMGDSGAVPSGVGAVNNSARTSGMRTFFAACAWAFMLAAGSMVYQHFLAKWEGSGLPILPIAALGTLSGGNPVMAQQQAQRGIPYQPPTNRGYAIPGSTHTQQERYQAPSNSQGSILDRYDC